MSVFLSCEQGGHLVPPSLNLLSDGVSRKAPRKSSQGPRSATIDLAAAATAKRLAELLNVKLIQNEFSPDLIDVRRSLHYRSLLGERTKSIALDERQWLIDNIYEPYRNSIRQTISSMLSRYSYVVHLSIQTFGLHSKSGTLRRTDVGLLYDPHRDDEVDLCLDWIDEMYDLAPMLKVRRNYPGRGTNDSLTKAMRNEFGDSPYLGIQLWLNRSWAGRDVSLRDEALRGLAAAFEAITQNASANAA